MTVAIKLIPISHIMPKAPAGMYRPVVYTDNLGLCLIETDTPNPTVAKALCNLIAHKKNMRSTSV